jgi:hypothetical protein
MLPFLYTVSRLLSYGPLKLTGPGMNVCTLLDDVWRLKLIS